MLLVGRLNHQHFTTLENEVNAHRRTHMQTNAHCNKKREKNTHKTPKHTERTEQIANEERERK